MGEEERHSFDDEVERRGPLATHFNFYHRFWSSKLDLSRPNTSDAFVNTMDVLERTEDGIDVNSFPFDECIPLCTGEPCWGTSGAPDPSLDSGIVSLEDVEDVSGLVAAEVRN